MQIFLMEDNVFGPSKTHNILYTDVYILLNSLSLSLFLSLSPYSCAAFLKTWLPFLMLTGIITTFALTLNL